MEQIQQVAKRNQPVLWGALAVVVLTLTALPYASASVSDLYMWVYTWFGAFALWSVILEFVALVKGREFLMPPADKRVPEGSRAVRAVIRVAVGPVLLGLWIVLVIAARSQYRLSPWAYVAEALVFAVAATTILVIVVVRERRQ
jgi:hypothetical protein